MKNKDLLLIRKFIVCAILCVTVSTTFSQNDIQQSNYMFNELSFNPAYTGSNKALRATLMARKQWFGFDYGPLTQTLCVDSETRYGGLGLTVINDQLGYEKSMHAKVMYSYSVPLSEKSALTAGFGLGMINRVVDATGFIYQNQVMDDPNGLYGTESQISPSFDFGLHLLHKNLGLGISSTHVQKSLSSATSFSVPRHYYGYAQYKVTASPKIALVPTLYVKSGGYITQVEANTNVYLQKKYWLGATYRVNESFVALAGIILKEKFYIGYSYDFNTGPVGPYSNGTHEIFISLRMKKETGQTGFYQSTRLFN